MCSNIIQSSTNKPKASAGERTSSVSLLAVITLIVTFQVLKIGPYDFLGIPDFHSFWCALKVFQDGENPYLLKNLILKSSESSLPEALPFVYPPIFLTIFSVFGVLSFQVAKLIFLGCAIASIQFVAWFFMRKSDLTPFALLVLAGLVSTFAPLLTLLQIGQITWLVGLLLYLVVASWRIVSAENRPKLGILFALLAIKPQITLPTIIFFMTLAAYEHQFKFFAYFIGGVAILSLSPLIINRHIWEYFLVSNLSFSNYYLHPNLETWIRLIFNLPNQIWIKYIFIILLSLLVVATAIKVPDQKRDKFLFLILLPLSLICAPYCWYYDFVILVPAVLCLGEHAAGSWRNDGNRLSLFVIFILFSANVILMTGPSSMHMTVWYPLLIMMLGCRLLK